MNIKELNAINLFAARHAALTHGVAKASALFGCDPTVMETMKALSDTRIQELSESIDVPLFGLRVNKSHSFWRDAAESDKEVDWSKITRMRSLLMQSQPHQLPVQ